jgi:acyl-CoA reductase-like NAD-dependent aldehyde dehydrogenase
MATDRIILHSRIAPAFIEAMKDALKPSDNQSSLPPTVVNAASKARVEATVRDALASGATSFMDPSIRRLKKHHRLPALECLLLYWEA